MSITPTNQLITISVLRPPTLVEIDKNDLLQLKVSYGTLDDVSALIATGFPVDLRNEDGATALHHAARIGNKAIYDLLHSKGANTAELTNGGLTPFLLAKAQGHTELCKQIKAQDKRAYAYSKEFILRKCLAHSLNIAGTTTILSPSHELQSITVSLEGLWPRFVWLTINKITQKYFKQNPNSASEIILDICHRSSSKEHQSAEALFRCYNEEKKPIVIRCGYKLHISSIILWGGFLVLCERGYFNKTPFEVVIVDKSKITEELIGQLLSLNSKTAEEYHLFLKSLKSYYLPKQLPIAAELTKHMFLPTQEVGNCTWTNTEAVIYALFVLHSLKYNAALPIPEQMPLTEICKEQGALFNTWKAFVIKSQVENYINKHATLPTIIPCANTLSSYPPEAQFIEKVQQKVPADLAQKLKSLLSS